MLNYNKKLDVRNLSCVLSVLKVKQIISQMQIGQVLYVIASGTKVIINITYFASYGSHELIFSAQTGKDKHFYFAKR